ncbi:MAG: FG-GAP-like repeat-containing protein [Bryobacteraceae bacterium]
MSNLYRFLSLALIVAAALTAQTVGSTTNLSVNSTSITQGSVATLTATVTVNGAAATGGTVKFLDGTRSLGTVQVIVTGTGVGTAVLRTNSFAGGSHSITANYSGAPNGAQHAGASNSAMVALTVQQTGPLGSATRLTSSQEADGTYDFTATVSSLGIPPPNGTVAFSDQTSGASLGSAALSSALAATFATPFQSSYGLSGFPTAIAVGDFNQDGVLDLAVANSNVSVFLGDPSNPGHFLNPVNYGTGSTAQPTSIVVADFNGDGVLDLATANNDGSISVLFGSATSPGNFLPPTMYPTGATLGSSAGFTLLTSDLDLDGLPDLVLVSDTAVILLNDPIHREHYKFNQRRIRQQVQKRQPLET